MTTSNNGSSGTAPSSGGATETPNNQNQPGTESHPETVAYDTYRKVLGEKKKRDEELTQTKKQLEEFQAKERAKEEEDLKKQKNYEQLLKLRDEELSKERGEKNRLREMAEMGLKRRSFLDAVNGVVEEQYWGLMNLDEIAIDPQTGMPDESSVLNAAREFEKKYALVLQSKSGGPRLPNDAPRGTARLTYEDWLKLPAKDQKARLKEVMN